MLFSLQLFAAIIMDGLFGDPPWYPHPVKIIGKIISFCEEFTRPLVSNQVFAGALTVSLVMATTGGTVYYLLIFLGSFSPVLASGVAIVLIYMSIACRDLIIHSLRVYRALVDNTSLVQARREVAKIVGRNTEELDRESICRACIETVAENMVDGIAAPLFWALSASFLSIILPLGPIEGAALGALLYKAINTMDSMIGYKNDKYLEFGKVAAKLDDLVNFIPARVSAVILIFGAFLLKLNYRGAARVFLRDRKKHSSPNAGHPEAVVAGALDIRLGGPQKYFNSVVDKPYIGDDINKPLAENIKQANSLVIVSAVIFLLFCLGVRNVIAL